MIAASTRCCSRAFAAFAALVLLALPAGAHKASDAYLQLSGDGRRTELRWDIALRDLDGVIAIDADGDAKITWGEVKAASPAIDAYALPRLALAGCRFSVARRGLEQRSDGAYAVLWLEAACPLPAEPALRYSLFAETDPTHRGLLSVARAGKPPELRVLDPTAAAAVESPSFLAEGVRHILTGYDHVLFLLCLLLPAVMRRTPSQGWQPVDRLRQAVLPVAGIVTAFTLAHSITLTLAALGWVSLPPAIIEPAIAVTIALTALDNLRPIFRLPRAAVAFGFGLIHGFGFAGVLAELELPKASFAWALLQFNLGIEAGQLAVVFAAVALLYALRRASGYPRWVIQGGSAAAMAVAALWFVERTTDLSLLPL